MLKFTLNISILTKKTKNISFSLINTWDVHETFYRFSKQHYLYQTMMVKLMMIFVYYLNIDHNNWYTVIDTFQIFVFFFLFLFSKVNRNKNTTRAITIPVVVVCVCMWYHLRSSMFGFIPQRDFFSSSSSFLYALLQTFLLLLLISIYAGCFNKKKIKLLETNENRREEEKNREKENVLGEEISTI